MTTPLEDAIAPPQSRGHLLGGLVALLLSHLAAFSLLPGEWYNAWDWYLAFVQWVYVWPLSWFFGRMHWRATVIGLWLGALATLLLPFVLWLAGWMARGGKVGIAGL